VKTIFFTDASYAVKKMSLGLLCDTIKLKWSINTYSYATGNWLFKQHESSLSTDDIPDLTKFPLLSCSRGSCTRSGNVETSSFEIVRESYYGHSGRNYCRRRIARGRVFVTHVGVIVYRCAMPLLLFWPGPLADYCREAVRYSFSFFIKRCDGERKTWKYAFKNFARSDTPHLDLRLNTNMQNDNFWSVI